jgi:hypothetical protein
LEAILEVKTPITVALIVEILLIEYKEFLKTKLLTT